MYHFILKDNYNFQYIYNKFLNLILNYIYLNFLYTFIIIYYSNIRNSILDYNLF